MRLYKDVKSKNRPMTIDIQSSDTAIYENSNIRTEEICAGHYHLNGVLTDLTQTMYVYDCMKYTRDEWIIKQIDELRNGLFDPIIDPTADLDTIIALKTITINNGCARKIAAGIDVEVDTGIEHFSLEPQDQFNIDNTMNKVILLGMKKIVFNSDSSFARLYTNHEFLKVALAAREFILRETIYANFACNYLSSLTEDDKDLIISFAYGDDLPLHLQYTCDEMVTEEMNELKQLIKDNLNIVIE